MVLLVFTDEIRVTIFSCDIVSCTARRKKSHCISLFDSLTFKQSLYQCCQCYIFYTVHKFTVLLTVLRTLHFTI